MLKLRPVPNSFLSYTDRETGTVKKAKVEITPAGTFDIDVGTNVYSLRNQYDNNVLIIRVDEQVAVYELEEGKKLKLAFFFSF